MRTFRHRYFWSYNVAINYHSTAHVKFRRNQDGPGVQAEAAVMKSLAISAGVSAYSIICEDKALTTVENMEYSKPLLESKGFHKVILITSEFHMGRAMIIYRNIIGPKIPVTESPHESGISAQGMSTEMEVETKMIAKYKTRFPNWDFSE